MGSPLSQQSNRLWFRSTVQLRGSVLARILPRVLFSACFALGVTLIHRFLQPIDLDALSSLVPSVVLGLLLVFRTNTAYERFWEGRRVWGNIINASRNFMRQLWVVVSERQPSDRAHKQEAIALIVAFAYCVKHWLRQESPQTAQLQGLVSAEQLNQLRQSKHPPLELAFWINDYLQRQYRRHRLNLYQLTELVQFLNQLVDYLGACERILSTPIPLAYSIHLKQLILLYCLALPFQLVGDLGWMTAPIVGIISFALMGIEAIGIEIENPFGTDPNDLPLDRLCEILRQNASELMQLEPGSSIVLLEAEKLPDS